MPADVDAIFTRFAARTVAPGLAYGVVIDGRLAHAAGVGALRDGVDVPPDRDSVFRIASMSKSFTAAAVLLLRDSGTLRLDDAAAKWVPALDGLVLPTVDSPPITIEHLLTMSAGLPTDDPWGDRQQGLDLGSFAELLRAGLRFAWTPGTRFEYSNLGYGILGRIVTAAAGMEYRDFVRERLLEPLGMAATTFAREDVPEERLALGYVRRDGSWIPEPIDPYGALASMGGVFTSVADLSTWIVGFSDAFPPRDGPSGHPLARSSRREMQQVHRSYPPEVTSPSADAAPKLVSGGYGYGLSIVDDLEFGRIVGHGGGYPGYGSYMCWHPASGIGVMAFGNGRYAPLHEPVREALAGLLRRHAGRIRRVTPWPETIDAQTVVEGLLERWDEGAARTLFAMNIDLDDPLSRRRAACERLREDHGSLRPDPTLEPESESPAHLAWWMNGQRGRVRVEIRLSPERPPLVQTFTVTSVLDPPGPLREIAQLLTGLLGQPGPSWPDQVSLAAGADRPAIERSLRAAEALFGPLALGPLIVGDGVKRATWRLTGERGELDLQVEFDASAGSVESVSFVPRAKAPPIHSI